MKASGDFWFVYTNYIVACDILSMNALALAGSGLGLFGMY